MKLLLFFTLILLLPFFPENALPPLFLVLVAYGILKGYGMPKFILIPSLIISIILFIVSGKTSLLIYPFTSFYTGYLMFVDTSEDEKVWFFSFFFPKETYFIFSKSIKSLKNAVLKTILYHKTRKSNNPVLLLSTIINLIFRKSKTIALTLYARLLQHNLLK